MNQGTYMFLTQLPTYMSEVLRFDIQQSGYLASIPYVSSWSMNIIGGFLSDKMIKSGQMSRTNVRKILNTIGKLFECALQINMKNCSAASIQNTFSQKENLT